jgi:hypothetical protein
MMSDTLRLYGSSGARTAVLAKKESVILSEAKNLSSIYPLEKAKKDSSLRSE